MPRHPLGGALRISEEPPSTAFYAGVERLWPTAFNVQIENVGLVASHSCSPDQVPIFCSFESLIAQNRNQLTPSSPGNLMCLHHDAFNPGPVLGANPFEEFVLCPLDIDLQQFAALHSRGVENVSQRHSLDGFCFPPGI